MKTYTVPKNEYQQFLPAALRQKLKQNNDSTQYTEREKLELNKAICKARLKQLLPGCVASDITKNWNEITRLFSIQTLTEEEKLWQRVVNFIKRRLKPIFRGK